MVAVLKRIAEETLDTHLTLGNQADGITARINSQGSLPTPELCYLYFQQGMSRLSLNQLQKGIESLQISNEIAMQIHAPRADLNQIRFYQGVAHLRLAETENCCATNNSDSCILPIKGEGIHTRKAGSQAAMRYFLDVLDHPSGLPEQQYAIDAPARWLLNLAAMTLGEYPESVPEQYRVSQDFFQSTETFPVFKNVLPQLHLQTENLCGGAISDDFDNDGMLDMFTTTFDPRGQSKFFRNASSGKLLDVTNEAGLTGILGGLNALQVDYNNDGFMDVFILRGAWQKNAGLHPNSLLQNNGDGTFTDVTFDVGLAKVWAPTKSADWADYDQDGDLDLFIGNETTPEAMDPSELYRNNGDGTFTEVATQAGVDVRVFVMGAVWGDYDQDHYPDLFISNGSIPGNNLLFHNRRDGTFEDVTLQAGVARPYSSFATWFWDINNDGNLDLYVTNSIENVGVVAAHQMKLPIPAGTETMGLYLGDGHGNFQDRAVEYGLTAPTRPMGANFGDLNGDGYLDFYLATGDVPYEFLVPNLMFLNSQGKQFRDITMAGGFGHLQKGHGVSFTDLNDDGMTDVYVQLGGAYLGDASHDALFENPGFATNWIKLTLVGRDSNRSAAGARVRVVIMENGQERSVYRHVDSGGSFGASPLKLTLGLGTATHVERIEIDWTNSATQVYENLPVNSSWIAVEGNPNLLTSAIHPGQQN